MISLDEFSTWMKDNTMLSDSSVYKYTRAVNTISNEMKQKGVIADDLLSMSTLYLDIFIPRILCDPDFVTKNKTGNNMYSNALKQFRLFRMVDNAEAVTAETVASIIPNYATLSETERTTLVKSRIGQGAFKKKLLEKYDSTCIVTGINEKRLLIASHVKPWAVCTNEERVSSENGLLLTPTFDKLFDSGLITFSTEGKIYFSSQLSNDVIGKLHVAEGDMFNLKMSSELAHNLQYHQDIVFVTQKRGKAI